MAKYGGRLGVEGISASRVRGWDIDSNTRY